MEEIWVELVVALQIVDNFCLSKTESIHGLLQVNILVYFHIFITTTSTKNKYCSNSTNIF